MNLYDTDPSKHTAEENSLDSLSSDFFTIIFFIVSATILFFRLSLGKTMTFFSFLSGPCTVVFYIQDFSLLLRMSSSLTSTF